MNSICIKRERVRYVKLMRWNNDKIKTKLKLKQNKDRKDGKII